MDTETTAEKIARLQREIAERQAQLQLLVLGDPRIAVGMEYSSGHDFLFGKPVAISTPVKICCHPGCTVVGEHQHVPGTCG